jgi:hypothetical protein
LPCHSEAGQTTDWWNPQPKPQSPPIRPSFPLQTLRPNPQSQSLSRGYGSILPTSLIYIILSTRGCAPWRPEAVMSTTRRENKSVHWDFKDRQERTGQHRKMLLCRPPYLIAGQSDSKVGRSVKKKRELFPGLLPVSPVSLVLPLIIHLLVQES